MKVRSADSPYNSSDNNEAFHIFIELLRKADAAKNHNLSENDALDAYYHGVSLEDGKMFKTYRGYEIGIFYWVASVTGVIVIIYIWKKDRR